MLMKIFAATSVYMFFIFPLAVYLGGMIGDAYKGEALDPEEGEDVTHNVS